MFIPIGKYEDEDDIDLISSVIDIAKRLCTGLALIVLGLLACIIYVAFTDAGRH